MKKTFIFVSLSLLFVTLLGSACQPAPPSAQPASAALRVLAVETFLADMAQQVAGDRLQVESLIPLGLDPHAFEPAPQDVARIADSQVLIFNGAGFEEWLDEVLQNAGGQRVTIDASAGLEMRKPQPGEEQLHGEEEEAPAEKEDVHEGDPHFWLDPLSVVRYVENIRDGLSAADPAGEDVYAQNAAAYIAELQDLHAWIEAQAAQIPPERRVLVTNHKSFGYFADRYGFTIVGAVIPSASTSASPSARQLAELVEHIRESGAPAIFLESGANPRLAEQVALESGARVITGLLSHSVTAADGPAPTYLTMMRYNVTTIVDALN